MNLIEGYVRDEIFLYNPDTRMLAMMSFFCILEEPVGCSPVYEKNGVSGFDKLNTVL